MSDSPFQASKTESQSQDAPKNPHQSNNPATPKVNLIQFLKPYQLRIIILFVLALVSNGIGLIIPRLLSHFIDQYQNFGIFQPEQIALVLGGAALGTVIFTFFQSSLSAHTSEKLAFDLRKSLSEKLASQSYNYVATSGSSKLLTILTSDVDKTKTIISQGIITAFSAIVLLVGSSAMLLITNWRLALVALSVVPLIAVTFGVIFKRVGVLFGQSQQILEKINKVINESVLGATLIRVLNSQESEIKKFSKVNQEAKENNLKIIFAFSSMIPIVNLLSNLATLGIIWYGGYQVIQGSLSLGEFTAFFAYLNLLIFPIFLLGFISNTLSSAMISLGRIQEVIDSPVHEHAGTVKKEIQGKIEFQNISLELDNRSVLKQVSFTIKPGTKTAILGPTAAGKTQIFNLIAGLNQPTSGQILLDDVTLESYDRESLYSQLGLVFQDSIMFNASLGENIQFRQNSSSENLNKAIETAALDGFVESLPEKLDTLIEERGANLSGGQKQRIMLARALTLNPKILLLDDFTARVDIFTENKILELLSKNYPDLTLISITQKIEPIKEYDQIIVIMEGELIAHGRHEELLETSLEYKQIWESQQSTEE